jgi:hypothetical protein
MVASGSSVSSVHIYQTTRTHISEDHCFHIGHRDIFKSHIAINIPGELIWIKLDHDEFQWPVFVKTVMSFLLWVYIWRQIAQATE